MKRKTIITLVLGTLLLFLWNAVSWMVLPFHSQTLNNMPEGVVDLEKISESDMESGIYHYPGFPADNSQEAMGELAKQLEMGPRVPFMVYRSEPTKLFDPIQFLWSLIINLLTVVLAYYLIKGLAIKTKKSILVYSLLIGLVIALVADISLLNWYFYPLDYTLINVLDRLISFGLIGLLFGYFTFKNASNG